MSTLQAARLKVRRRILEFKGHWVYKCVLCFNKSWVWLLADASDGYERYLLTTGGAKEGQSQSAQKINARPRPHWNSLRMRAWCIFLACLQVRNH
jgi:hypothetical protein